MAVGKLRARERDHEDRPVPRPLQQVLDELDEGRVSPLDVLEDQNDRTVLGHPLNVMAWLADELPRFGLRLCRGDVVTTGVATDVFEAGVGDSCVADFGPFGTVTVTFG